MIGRRIHRLVRRLSHKSELSQDQTVLQHGEMSPDWYDKLYQDRVGYQQPYYLSHYYFLWTVIADRLRTSGIRRVLEIGCGPGQLATLLFEQGVDEYVGLDFSPAAIAFAQKANTKGRFILGDASVTSIHEEVDHEAVICTEVLEHIRDDLAVLSRFRPKKRCLFSIPSFTDPSHVRLFRNQQEVRDRYGPFFEKLDVIALRSPYWLPSAPDTFFLADGVRNSHVTEKLGQENGDSSKALV